MELVLHGEADRLKNNIAITWFVSDSLTSVTQLFYILCLLFLICIPLPKGTLGNKEIVLRTFPITLYFIYNKWRCAYWICPFHTTFSHPKQEFIALHSFDMNSRPQLMPFESTSIANKTHLQRKYLMQTLCIPLQNASFTSSNWCCFLLGLSSRSSVLCVQSRTDSCNHICSK